MSVDLSGARWFKSSHSSGSQECVEVAHVDAGVGVRDSKNPTGPALVFTPVAWGGFTAAVRRGELGPA
ncbi:DUF397 domain-containing protein [Nocardia cyriacigeorgica]|uniref:DUF397 domain-containing protein n=1 Tax=Nocardia cyriacigeorgica TaxID=135487 RepID=UPI000566D0B1|nr:DUF397 domain-containing protein [Nocardia cyriacigeorgica]MBF6083352.1 DUF397 domain-containing protein [Nocardia cyriacigeorgica]TLF57838.1 DUF397 domain-containing protein [Nocardia cyriacigeorgica]